MTSSVDSTDDLPRLVIPGDVVDGVSKEEHVLLGPGLRREGPETVVASVAGVLRRKKAGSDTAVLWVDGHSRRYVPNKGENVVGVVLARVGDFFRVDIGAAEPASLAYLAFEGATKKNRPNGNVGDVVYSKLLAAGREAGEPELVCVDSYGKKAGLGVLANGGFVLTVPLHVVRKLLSPDCPLLKALGKAVPFEVAVGMNGRIWLRGRTAKDTISLANAISAAEFMTNDECTRMVAKLADAMAGF